MPKTPQINKVQFFSVFMKGIMDTSGTISDLGGWTRPVGGVNIDVENNVS